MLLPPEREIYPPLMLLLDVSSATNQVRKLFPRMQVTTAVAVTLLVSGAVEVVLMATLASRRMHKAR